MADPITPAQPHDEAEELLPWYATGRLEIAERERVEAHLAECSGCRRQLAQERGLIREFRSFSPEVDSGWTRIGSRLSIGGRGAAAGPGRKFAEFARGLWAAFTQPVVVAFASAQVVFLAFASGLVFWLSQPTYHALGSGAAPVSANLIVMFRADATEHDVRGALQTASASIVGGPTAAGAYLIHVQPRQRPLALARLQANDYVQLAEPIDAGTAP